MFQNIFEIPYLRKAFLKVKSNKGSFGIDRISLKKYEKHLDKNLKGLSQLLKQGKYHPLPVKRVYIPKSNGNYRPLGIPAVRDRIVQQILKTAIEPFFEPLFANSSYGFRPNRSAIQAIHKVEEYLNQGCEYIVEADIKSFFDNLCHDRLVAKVRERVNSKPIIKLIRKFLKSGVMEEGKIKKQVSGTPQGGVISPLLANIYLNDFDHKIERAGLKLVRYADDFVILCSSPNQASFALKMVRELISSMKLELAPAKTKITWLREGFEFLGYRFIQYYGNHKGPRDKAIRIFKEKIKYLTRRQQPKNVLMVIRQINPVIRGWGNYFKYGQVKKKFQRLDEWTRMRLRSFIEKKKWSKNWKYPNDHFRRLGLVSLEQLLVYQQAIFFPT